MPTTQPPPPAITAVDTGVTAFVGSTAAGMIGAPMHLDGWAGYEPAFGAPGDLEMAHAVRQYFINGGTRAEIVRAASPSGPDLVAALEALDDHPFNLLSVPETASLSDVAASGVITAAITLCTSTGAFFIVDPPQLEAHRDTVEAIDDWLAANGSLRSDHAAVYIPRPLVPDETGGDTSTTRSASGTMAGVFARVDEEDGVWKAPAGVDAVSRGVVGLDHHLTDDENGALTMEGINGLRHFDHLGYVAWGARTLAGPTSRDPEVQYISVRRTSSFLVRSIERGTQWAVFEPNDEAAWSRGRIAVEAFMMELWHRGSFVGTKPSEAFFVRCDRTTTTPSDIDAGLVVIVVGFAPLKPAEFVTLRIARPAGTSEPKAPVVYRKQRLTLRGDLAVAKADELAEATGTTVHKINVAAITSKYIGETEKNLAELLALAEKVGTVILFEEADALVDQEAQSRLTPDERAAMRKRIERYPGPVVFATRPTATRRKTGDRRRHRRVDQRPF